jgi:hypothetical protein
MVATSFWHPDGTPMSYQPRRIVGEFDKKLVPSRLFSCLSYQGKLNFPDFQESN